MLLLKLVMLALACPIHGGRTSVPLYLSKTYKFYNIYCLQGMQLFCSRGWKVFYIRPIFIPILLMIRPRRLTDIYWEGYVALHSEYRDSLNKTIAWNIEDTSPCVFLCFFFVCLTLPQFTIWVCMWKRKGVRLYSNVVYVVKTTLSLFSILASLLIMLIMESRFEIVTNFSSLFVFMSNSIAIQCTISLDSLDLLTWSGTHVHSLYQVCVSSFTHSLTHSFLLISLTSSCVL